MIDKQKQVKDIIDKAIDDIVAVGMNRPDALQLFAFQCVIRLCLEGHDAKLMELREQLLAEIETSLTPADDETMQ